MTIQSEPVCTVITMGCPPVRGDNRRALAIGLSHVQVDKHGITIFTTYISVDIAYHEIFHTKIGKGSIKYAHHICVAKMLLDNSSYGFVFFFQITDVSWILSIWHFRFYLRLLE